MATPPSGPISTAPTHASKGSIGPKAASAFGGSSSSQSAGTGNSSTETSDRDRSRAKDAAKSAAKSFRVTLDDPCWKVLPAALKKYKINDDWKMYALFICFGNTGEQRPCYSRVLLMELGTAERCLSYDEKPLMLFQKLKEGGQKPVFMLRHMASPNS